MLEPELKSYLDATYKSLLSIDKKLSSGSWKSFLHGILGGVGSIIGAAAAILLIGYLLNIFGIIPAFRNEVRQIQHLLQQAAQKQYLPNDVLQ
jgi:hypothetical protein